MLTKTVTAACWLLLDQHFQGAILRAVVESTGTSKNCRTSQLHGACDVCDTLCIRRVCAEMYSRIAAYNKITPFEESFNLCSRPGQAGSKKVFICV